MTRRLFLPFALLLAGCTKAPDPPAEPAGRDARVAVRVGFNSGERVEVLALQHSPGTWQDVTGAEELVVSDVTNLSEGQTVTVK